MVSRGYFGVFDGDGSTHGLAGAPGSEVIEKLFVDHLTGKGITVTPAVFTGGSDYASFMDTLHKPVGGLHTGKREIWQGRKERSSVDHFKQVLE